jgi:hypothetical protein
MRGLGGIRGSAAGERTEDDFLDDWHFHNLDNLHNLGHLFDDVDGHLRGARE